MEININVKEAGEEVSSILMALRVQFRELHLLKDMSTQFLCEQFGTIISCLIHYKYIEHIEETLNKLYPNYRYIYLTDFSNIVEVREQIIWALARGGFFRHVRSVFPKQFTDLVTLQSYGERIIQKRLEFWADRPKYKYLIEENRMAREMSAIAVLARDPSFFDYIPE